MHAQPTILCLKTLKPRYARNDNTDELRQVMDENIGHGDVTDGSLYVGVQIFVLYSHDVKISALALSSRVDRQKVVKDFHRHQYRLRRTRLQSPS